MAHPLLLDVQPLGFPWRTLDPFLFCVHHEDAYPKGNGRFGPAASLAGRQIGADFAGKDGWRMYHGETVPGFPAHPHRGFETVTVVRRGFIDHADSLGAAARFGSGDVQWLTTGRGIVHAEMFPLLDAAQPNPLELFQIWLNLPARSKMAEPHFKMLWAEQIPRHLFTDDAGRVTEVVCTAGRLAGSADTAAVPSVATPPSPPPNSWAASADADVAIWTIWMAPGADCTLPPAASLQSRRMLYFFRGASITIGSQPIDPPVSIELRADQPLPLKNGDTASEFLLLQGRPIGEPVAQHGPFVMNTRQELQRAIDDYHRTEFGGWPWPDHAPVHGGGQLRFARDTAGRLETFDSAAAPLLPTAPSATAAGRQ